MTVRYSIATSTGLTLAAELQRYDTAAYWDNTGNSWSASPTDSQTELTEGTGVRQGSYTGSINHASIASPGLCLIRYINQTTSKTIAIEETVVLNSSSVLITGVKLNSDGLDNVLIESSISATTNLVDDAGSQLTSINARQALALAAAAGTAVLTGAATTTVEIYPVAKPLSSPRVSGGTDANGNRSNIVTRVPT